MLRWPCWLHVDGIKMFVQWSSNSAVGTVIPTLRDSVKIQCGRHDNMILKLQENSRNSIDYHVICVT